MSTSDTTTNPPLKRCSKCGNEYPATREYFYVCTGQSSGFKSACKKCTKQDAAKHYREHAEEERERGKKRWREHKEYCKAIHARWVDKYPERAKASQDNYARNNPEKRKAHSAAWRREHPERVKEYQVKWRREHQDLVRAGCQKRRARKLSAEGAHTAKDIREQLKRQKGKCYYCGGKLENYHVDHVIPLSRGGSDGPDNLVIACPHCNDSKGTKLPHEWPKGGRLL